jgi:6-phosphogluconolactonase
MKEKRIFAYVGTRPGGLAPGFLRPPSLDPSIKTGIFGFRMDTENGDWTPTRNFYTSSVLSMLCSTVNGKFLYSTDETRNRKGIPFAGGGILAFSIDSESGELKFINEKSSMGTNPVYAEVDTTGHYVFVANVGLPQEKFVKVIKTGDGKFKMMTEEEEGTIAMFSILKNGGVTDVIDMVGFRGVYHEEQGEAFSHHHCIKIDPSNNFVLTCDTKDKIHVFRIDYRNGKLVPAENPSFKTYAGVEPRFLVFHPIKPWFFVNNQRNSTVYSFSFNSTNGKIEELDYASAVFNEHDSSKSWTSDIAVHRNGKYLYVSSRSLQKQLPNANCPPSTIAVFDINQKTGRLILKAVTPVADNPRGVAFSPDCRYLYVASLDTDVVIRYKTDPDTGMLSDPAVAANVPAPASIKFVTIDSSY